MEGLHWISILSFSVTSIEEPFVYDASLLYCTKLNFGQWRIVGRDARHVSTVRLHVPFVFSLFSLYWFQLLHLCIILKISISVRFRWFKLWPLKKLFIFDFLKGLLYHVIVVVAAVTSTITATDWVEKQDLTSALCYSSSSFRKTSMQWWIGLTKLILCAAYQCMGLQSAIFQVRKLMQQDLCASCLMIWNQEFQCSSAELGFCLSAFYILLLYSSVRFSCKWLCVAVCWWSLPSNWEEWAKC